MVRIAVLSDGLVGLLSSHLLLDRLFRDIELLYVDERAEIGFPNQGSGIISSPESASILAGWSNVIGNEIELAVNSNLAVSVGWLEKNLAFGLANRCMDSKLEISVRTECETFTPTSVELKGAGLVNGIWCGDHVIDCRRPNSAESLRGAIQLTASHQSFERTDGLWECWRRAGEGNSGGGVLEHITGYSSSVDEMTVDAAIQRARELIAPVLAVEDEKGNSK